PVEDARSLTNAIQRLGEDIALRQRLGEAGRRRVSRYALAEALAAWDEVIGWQPTVTSSS
ncbi:MAG: hypothetical protein M3O61_05925, partial [Gemmatimonadota bacterium]|nr:hypothetical protein [Gemmatimonadota bacterium]